MPVRSTALSVVLLACGALLAASVDAGAQSYPDRPIKIVVPVGPAGSYDIVGRLLADQLSSGSARASSWRTGPARERSSA